MPYDPDGVARRIAASLSPPSRPPLASGPLGYRWSPCKDLLVTLQLVQITPPGDGAGSWDPWESYPGDGFRHDWWGRRPIARDEHCLSVLEGGVEVVRAALGPFESPAQFPDAPLRGSMPLEIQRIEVVLDYQHRKRYGTQTVALLTERYRGHPLVARSANEAEGFWAWLGWSRHLHVEDIGDPLGNRLRFHPLYVQP